MKIVRVEPEVPLVITEADLGWDENDETRLAWAVVWHSGQVQVYDEDDTLLINTDIQTIQATLLESLMSNRTDPDWIDFPVVGAKDEWTSWFDPISALELATQRAFPYLSPTGAR